MEYLNLVSSHGYPGIEASDVEQQKRAAQSRKYLGIINSRENTNIIIIFTIKFVNKFLKTVLQKLQNQC